MADTLPALHLYRCTTPTPIGEFVVLVDSEGAVRLSNWTEFEEDAMRRLRRSYRPQEVVIECARTTSDKVRVIDGDDDVASHAVRQMRRYFYYSPSSDGSKSEQNDDAEAYNRHRDLQAILSSVQVHCNPSTPLAQVVWAALREVRCGETTTYAKLAAACRRPSATRAVGQALGANHACVFLPCHRVVGASHALTGFGPGLWRKSWLLQHERAPNPVAQARYQMVFKRTARKRGRQ